MLKKNLVANSLNQIVSVGFPIIVQIYLVRHLDLADIGFWNVLLAVQGLVVLCSSITPLYAIRRLSASADSHEHSLYLTNVLILDYLMLVLPFAAGLSYTLYAYPANYHIVLVSFLPLLTAPLAAEYYFQATLRNELVLYRRLFSRSAFLLLLFGLVRDPSSFLTFVYIASLTTALEHLISLCFVARLFDRRLLSIRALSTTFLQSIGYLSFNLSYNTLPHLSIVVGARVLQADTSAVFSILMKLVNLATTFVSSSVMVIYPYRLRRKAAQVREGKRDDYRLFFGLTAATAAAVTIGLIVSADLIELLFLNSQTAGFGRDQYYILTSYVAVHSIYNYIVFNHFFERGRMKEVIISNLSITFIFFAAVWGVQVTGGTPALAAIVTLSALCPAIVALAISIRQRRTG